MPDTNRGFIPNPEGPFPPLPVPVPPFPEPPTFPLPEPQPLPLPPWVFRKSLRCGCYLTRFTPTSGRFMVYDGTIRVECNDQGRTASGDLYKRPTFQIPFPHIPNALHLDGPANLRLWPVPTAGPNPANGIPIFSRGAYRYYLQITQLLEQTTIRRSFVLGFNMWRFTKTAGGWNTGGTWTDEGARTARMSWQTAPSGYPSSGDYLTGDVEDSNGTIIGRLEMGWVSKYLRKATVEIDRVAQSESPLNNGAGVDWRAVGDSVDWDITVDESDANIAEPSGESWSDGECHAEMLARRDASNLDREWRYHVLCVRRLDSTERGIMYDAYGSDSNNVPREGCAISSHWTIPNADPWGLVKGMRFGTATSSYFRTAVHETGHAMGLYHNTADNGYMNTTNVIAGNAADPGSPAFPNNIQWSYNPEDARRLRHMPDVYVRPGGTPFGTSYSATPISPQDFELEERSLVLNVSPLLNLVPIGAPVRFDLELVNTSDQQVLAPSSLSLKSGFVRGFVIDPSGTARTFSPLLLCIDDHPLKELQHKQPLTNSITLLRGGQGALFPMPGAHHVVVEVRWANGDGEVVVRGETSVMIGSAVDEAHAKTALRVLNAPDTLLSMVIGGDHLVEGNDAIQAAVEDKVLRPHFAYIAAKRSFERFRKRKANLRAAAELLDDAAVMSSAELKKAAGYVKADRSNAGADALVKQLKSKARSQKVADDVKKVMDLL